MIKKSVKKVKTRLRPLIFSLAILTGALWVMGGLLKTQRVYEFVARSWIFDVFVGGGMVLIFYGAAGFVRWSRKQDDTDIIFVGNEKLQLFAIFLLAIIGIGLFR